jgi:tRNA (guanosine-2'-O-)-methyltransferase
MDELEDAMRVAAIPLAEAERLIAEHFERERWPLWQRTMAWREIVRRASDVPFLAELVAEARRIGEHEELVEPDLRTRAWGDDDETLQPADAAADGPEAHGHTPEPDDDTAPPDDEPPPRLRAAERALAHKTRSLTVVLEELTNARNAAAVVRTADALGLLELHIVLQAGRMVMNRSVTTTCQRWLDTFQYRSTRAALDRLRERGFTILAADFAPGALPIEEVPLSSKIALVFGSEQRGVSDTMRREADGIFYIPTVGFAAYLNVSVAAGVSLFSIDRRMREAGLRAPIGEDEKRRLRRAWYASLAGRKRRDEYLRWVDRPPAPAPDHRPLPSREKAWTIERRGSSEK